jgi:hypothetical protein
MYDNKVEEIANLKKELKLEREQKERQTVEFQKKSSELTRRIKTFQADSTEVKRVKSEKKTFDTQLKAKSDSIVALKSANAKKDEQITAAKREDDQKASAKFQEGKNDALLSVVNAYKKPFDYLILCSTKESVQHDLSLVGNNNAEIRQTLSDLEKYFSAKELLSKKQDDYRIKDAINQLKATTQNSKMIVQLQSNLESYKNYSDGLKETIGKIIEIDKKEIAEGNDFVQQQKLNKILSEISQFVFNYDFNFTDYPYLSDIVLEIMKRKQPNADADITDLLNKL